MATLIREDVAYQGNHKSILPQHQKVDGEYAVTGEVNPLPMKVSGSDVMQPVDVQSRYQQTIQTHNAVSVVNAGYGVSTYIDTAGFQEIGITVKNDAGKPFSVNLGWSNDGTVTHGRQDGVITNTSALDNSGVAPTRARYVSVSIANTDTVAHTFSAWVYLKA